MSKLYDLLLELETDNKDYVVNPDDLYDAYEQEKQTCSGISLESHFKNRFKTIPFEHIFNILINLEKACNPYTGDDCLYTFNKPINDVLLDMYFIHHSNSLLFYYILDHDPRSICSLQAHSISYIANLSSYEINKTVTDFKKYTTFDIAYAISEHCNFFIYNTCSLNKGKELLYRFAEAIDDSTRYHLLCKIISQDNIIRPSLQIMKDYFASSLSLRLFAKNDIICNGDNSDICKAILKSKLSISVIHSDFTNSFSIYQLITECSEYVPNTIEYIFKNAVKERLFYLVYGLRKVYDRRKLLAIFSENHNECKTYIELLVKDFGESEDIKRLLPFI